MKERLAAIFLTRTRDEWCEIMEGTDVCFAPVLTMSEARSTRTTWPAARSWRWRGSPSPAPAPRFSRTEATIQRPPAHAGQHTDEVLGEWLGADAARLAGLRGAGAIA